MSEVALAHKYSSEIHDKALSNIIDRWEQGGDDPVKYDDAAIGMGKSTVSVALKFLAEIGLLDSPKAGHYTVPEIVIEYRNKFGEVQQQAKNDVEERISGYPVYDEAKFLLQREKYTLDELSKEIAGSSQIAADKDELGNMKRSLRILAELGFLEIGEDGDVSIPDDRNTARNEGGKQELKGESDEETETASREYEGENIETQPEPEQTLSEQGNTRITAEPQLVVNVDISINMAEIEPDELRKKLEITRDVFGNDES